MAAVSSPVARTPLHYWHVAHGAHFTDSDGWQVPAVYTSVEQETAVARTGLAVADISAWAKISLLGPAVGLVAQALVPESRALRPGGVARFHAGGPVLACRLTDDRLLLLAAMTNAAALEQHLQTIVAGHNVVQSPATTARAAFVLVGPKVESLLRRVTSIDVGLAVFPVDACAETGLAGVHALLVRTAELTIPAVRVCVAWDVAEYVWERLLQPAPGWSVAPMGVAAWERLIS